MILQQPLSSCHPLQYKSESSFSFVFLGCSSSLQDEPFIIVGQLLPYHVWSFVMKCHALAPHKFLLAKTEHSTFIIWWCSNTTLVIFWSAAPFHAFSSIFRKRLHSGNVWKARLLFVKSWNPWVYSILNIESHYSGVCHCAKQTVDDWAGKGMKAHLGIPT